MKCFFERFEFLVCSKFSHTQCGRTCACAVACLCPHNSISNFVVSSTIHDNLNNICKRCSKLHETFVEGHKHIHVRIHVHFHTHTYIHVHVHIHIHVQVHVRVRVRVFVFVLACCCCCRCGLLWLMWWRRKRGAETNRTMSQLIPSAVSLRIAETDQLYQAKRMIGGIGNVLLSSYSQT